MKSRQTSIDAIRRFNRTYVPAMRLLDRSYQDTGMSTLETAALLEIGEHDGCSARDISRTLNMDKGYLSRALSRFEKEGLITRTPSSTDARVQTLSLTGSGKAAEARLTQMGTRIVENAFSDATDEDLAQVAAAMNTVLAFLKR
ncbi:MAG: MarR family winged helix-turn-helix transcriptional regulator [Eggerthellaceae bacterium]|jgi:DNA-binding MarR family transcriptional regulator